MSDYINKLSSPKTPKRWRKSISLPDGTEKSICVKEIENGYIIEFNKSWPTKDGEYKCEEKTLYSKENPLKDSEPELDSSAIESFLNPPIELM